MKRPIPIECTLDAGSVDDRVEEWRRFLGEAVTRVERAGTAARLLLVPGDEAQLWASDLARRERACCAFFEFRLDLRPEAVWLEVSAPDDAQPVLDGLLDLTPRAATPPGSG